MKNKWNWYENECYGDNNSQESHIDDFILKKSQHSNKEDDSELVCNDGIVMKIELIWLPTDDEHKI